MLEDVSYAGTFRKDLIDKIGIPDNIISDGHFHAAGVGYVKWLQSNTNLGWFAFQVSRIACIYVSFSFQFPVLIPEIHYSSRVGESSQTL